MWPIWHGLTIHTLGNPLLQTTPKYQIVKSFEYRVLNGFTQNSTQFPDSTSWNHLIICPRNVFQRFSTTMLQIVKAYQCVNSTVVENCCPWQKEASVAKEKRLGSEGAAFTRCLQPASLKGQSASAVVQFSFRCPLRSSLAMLGTPHWLGQGTG